MDCKLIQLSFANISGILYPPKNKITVIVENITIELYSLKKKNTKGTEECSVINPETSSDSASCKSKGVLDVSANIEMKYNKNTGNNGITNQTVCWCSIILIKFKDPVISITIKIAELKTSS